MIGFLGGKKNQQEGEPAGLSNRQDSAHAHSQPSEPAFAAPPPHAVHTIPPRAQPAMRAAPPRSPGPPPLPMHPSQLNPPPRTPPHSPQAPPSVPSAPPQPTLDSPPGANYEMMRTLYDTREAVARELAVSSKEFQVLRSLRNSDLDVCQDLVQELRRRLDTNPLFKALGKLDEAYAFALRYRRPPV